jgi:transposase
VLPSARCHCICRARKIVIDVEDKTCACCGRLKHRIGEDERLDVIPAQFKVVVTRRPKYACDGCLGRVSQAPAPERLIEKGIPTEAMVAHLLVAKYADRRSIVRRRSMPGKASRSIGLCGFRATTRTCKIAGAAQAIDQTVC